MSWNKIKTWWEKHTEYQLTEIEQSIVSIIQAILDDPNTEIYTPGERPYILKCNKGICRVSDSCIKLFYDDKFVLHDVTQAMAYKVKTMIRDKVTKDVSEIEQQLDNKIVNFIKDL